MLSRERPTTAGEGEHLVTSNCPILPSHSTICPCPCHPLIIDEIKHPLYHSPFYVLAFAKNTSNKLVYKLEFSKTHYIILKLNIVVIISFGHWRRSKLNSKQIGLALNSYSWFDFAYDGASYKYINILINKKVLPGLMA